MKRSHITEAMVEGYLRRHPGSTPSIKNPRKGIPPPVERTQLAILERFATRLVTETMETPHAALDAINNRFWDLI